MLVAELSIFDIPILLYIKSMLLICTASFNITSLRAVRPIASSSVCYQESKRGFKIKYLKIHQGVKNLYFSNTSDTLHCLYNTALLIYDYSIELEL